jgi:hypothetical protein
VLASILSQLRNGDCTYFIDKLHRNVLERKMTIKKKKERRRRRRGKEILWKGFRHVTQQQLNLVTLYMTTN